jgi:hypothetical protein
LRTADGEHDFTLPQRVVVGEPERRQAVISIFRSARSTSRETPTTRASTVRPRAPTSDRIGVSVGAGAGTTT